MKSFLFILSTLFFNIALFAQSGLPDMGFGESGYAYLKVQGYDECFSVAVQQDNKVLIAGRINNGVLGSDAVLARFTSDGKPDSAFGTNGQVRYNNDNDDSFRHIGIQSDGKIVVLGGYVSQSTFLWFIRRYHVNGSLDTSFNQGSGHYQLQVPDANYRVLRILPGNKILIGGEGGRRADSSAFLLRLLPNATPDATFGNAGLRYVPMAEKGRRKSIHDVQLLPSGKMLVVGDINQSLTSGIEVLMLAQLHASGEPDSSFSANGFHAFHSLPSNAYRLLLQADGKILVGGRVATANGYDLMVSRFNNNGTLDTLFADSGTFTYPSGYSGAVNGLHTDATGHIYYAGNIQQINGWNSYMAVGKLLPDGSRDNGFRDTSIAIYSPSALTTKTIGMYAIGNNRLLIGGHVFENSDMDLVALQIISTCSGINNKQVSYQSGKLISEQASATYQWLDCGNGYSPVSGATSKEFLPPTIGSYCVVINQGGCIDTSLCISYPATGIAEASNLRVSVYPNPVTNWLQVSANFPVQHITILTMEGRTYEKNMSHTKSIDVSALQPGIYYLQVKGNDGNAYIRFCKVSN
jgi:uncharacterized delta-60 repeat protein